MNGGEVSTLHTIRDIITVGHITVDVNENRYTINIHWSSIDTNSENPSFWVHQTKILLIYGDEFRCISRLMGNKIWFGYLKVFSKLELAIYILFQIK